MDLTLVVVESPAKAKAIEQWLGEGYVVRAVHGHGAPPSDLNGAMQHANRLVLATDFDRQGEAIAMHVAAFLGEDAAQADRVTFTEITRDAILEAFAHPRRIDGNLIDAQEARRVMDRLMTYRASPVWNHVKPSLPMDRAQSVAVRLIVEREREIDAFVPVEYW